MILNTGKKIIFVLTVLVATLSLTLAPSHAAVLNITATQPWIALLASFVGGANVEVTSLQTWDSSGRLVPANKGRAIKELSPETHVIALDPNDAKTVGLELTRERLRVLYSPFPIETSNVDASMSDPSVLPFVAQRVMTALSAWDPTGYTYYQRRLAEFQARLSSSVLAGRQVLRGIAICDITGSSSALFQAAGCQIERPDMAQLESWAKSNRASLKNFVESRKADGATIVMDNATSSAIRSVIDEKQQGVFMLKRPPLDQDYPSFLHDQYISLWQKITARPLTGKK